MFNIMTPSTRAFGYIIDDHLYNESGNPLSSLRVLRFPISNRGYFIVTITERITPITVFVTPAVDISRSSQCSTTGVTKAVLCAILSVGWCI